MESRRSWSESCGRRATERAGKGKGACMTSPFLLPDHCDYAEVLTDAAVQVLATRGVATFSVSAMARWMKVSPQAALNMYSRSRVIEVVTICFAKRWLAWSISEIAWLRQEHPCPLRLPRTAEERHGVRVLAALDELARGEQLRGNPLPAGHHSRLRKDETDLLRFRLAELSPSQLHSPAGAQEVRGLLALVSGLRLALVQQPVTLTWDEAGRQFAAAASAVASSEPDGRTRPPDLLPPNEPAA